MKTTRILTILLFVLAVIFSLAKVSKAAPLGTAFTYQGHLYDNNDVANDLYDLQFKLYGAGSGGSQVGNDVNAPDVDVIDGYFTVELDFGVGIFYGNTRWLEIGVRPGELEDPCDYTILEPRQEVTPTPYAIYAKTAGHGHSLDAADGSPINAVYVDNDGDVGIGTTSPSAKLHIDSEGNTELRIEHDDFKNSISFYASTTKKGYIEKDDDCGLLRMSADGINDHITIMQSTGKVGIGTSVADGKLHVVGSSSQGVHGDSDDAEGVWGENSTSGNYGYLGSSSYGVYGYNSSGNFGHLGSSAYGVYGTSSSGYGVYGYASNSGNATNYGGYFQAAGYSGRGVYGYASNSGDVTNYGGYFKATGSSGRGIYGEATGITGRGVYGQATSTGGSMFTNNYGGYFTAAGNYGRGVYGKGSGEHGVGAKGDSAGKYGTGVWGWASYDGDTTNYGGYFSAAGQTGQGVFGTALGASGVGVYGKHWSSGNNGQLGGSDFGVKSEGDLLVTEGDLLVTEGDLVVTGAYKGDIGPNNGAPFPRPAYDSGWVSFNQRDQKTLTHNIGGNVDNYVVDMQFKDTDGGGWGVNTMGIGLYEYGGDYKGAAWENLSTSSILVYRASDDPFADQIRIRIWVYN